MRRWMIYVTLILLVAGIMAFIVMMERRRVPDWKETLNAYVTERSATSPVTVVTFARADRPDAFVPAMGEPARASAQIWQDVDLDYPPGDAYCVVLDRGGTHELIVVTLHSDGLYRRGWIVQQGPLVLAPSEFARVTTALDCRLSRQ